MKVRFTRGARAEFLAVLAYLREENPFAASRFREQVERTLRRLGDFPDCGHRIPEFADLPYREVIIAPYRFFYREAKGAIWIVAVWHGARMAEPPRGP